MALKTERRAPKPSQAPLRSSLGPLLPPSAGQPKQDQVSAALREPGSHLTYLVYQPRAGTGGRDPERSAKDHRTAELPRPGPWPARDRVAVGNALPLLSGLR